MNNMHALEETVTFFFTGTCPLNPTSKPEIANKYLIVWNLDELKFEQVA